MSAAEGDAGLMARALALAARGDYRVGRNPRVGAVLARGGEVLAEGSHLESGGPHAEAAALAALASPDAARGATLYVSLEPCGPFEGKRTPPCVEAVIAAGVARVVIATLDPHPAAAGRSVERLRAAGVAVEVGLLGDAARALNGPYLKWQRAGSPFVTAKWAMSLDGKLACASGHSRWISGATSRRAAHALRGEVDAVLVGSGTALADDPLLTRRDAPGRDPLRVVVDSRGRLPLEARLVCSAREQGPVLVATTPGADASWRRALEARGVELLLLPGEGERVDLEALLAALAARDVHHALVEGGAGLLGALLDRRLVDRVVAFVAPRLLGGAAAPTPIGGHGAARVDEGALLTQVRTSPSGEDVRIEGELRLW